MKFPLVRKLLAMVNTLNVFLTCTQSHVLPKPVCVTLQLGAL